MLLARASRRTWRSSAAFPARTATPTSPVIPKTSSLPGVIAFRPEASLIYVNADAVLESVLNRVRCS